MKNKITKLDEQNLCVIIMNSKTIHKDVEQYLREHNIPRHVNKKRITKDLIKELINKYQLNKSISIPRYDNLIPYTQEEFDVIVGGLLGDTWIGKYRKGQKNADGSFTHKIEHYEYCKYKYEILARRCSNFTIHNKFDKRTNRNYQQVFCKLAASSLLNPIYKAFYKNKVKIISKEYINKLSPLGIAIWFMDDGSSDSCGYKFAVDCFSDNDIQLLREMLLNKFNIYTTYHKNQNKSIHVLMKSAKQFKSLVEPYICDCMKYKLQIYKTINGKQIKTNLVVIKSHELLETPEMDNQQPSQPLTKLEGSTTN